MITGSSPREANAAAQAEEARAAVLEKYGRVPIDVQGLVAEVNAAGWPSNVIVHPLDFLFLTPMMGTVHKDNEGPYVYLSITKIRPGKGTSETMDLTDWAPPRVALARFA